jgi:hypothetical protein
MLYVITVFLSAFLLFQVQPLVAKLLLPWFGGTPMVWTICQMFFQIVLLAGYVYGHALTTRGRAWRQYQVHVGVLLAAAAGMAAVAAWSGAPLLAAESMKQSVGDSPGLQLFALLVVTTGLPAFAVSTTGPLLQRWHARTAAPIAGTYRLYAVSNAGSLLGLLSYPFVTERWLTVPQQAWTWAAAFIVFAIGTAIIARRAASQPDSIARADGASESTAPAPPRLSVASVALWLVLSLVGSMVLLATTSHLSQDVAAVPFLWVLPLALYLITFIICFEHPQWYSRQWMLILASAATIWVASAPIGMSLPLQFVANGLLVFSFCMLCHGELVRGRPGASHLTAFYVVIALGGALGAVLVGVAAPLLLPDVWEFHLVMVAGWLVVALAWWLDRTSPFFASDGRAFALCLALGAFMAIRSLIERTSVGQVAWILANPWTTTAIAVIAPVVAARLLLWRSELARMTYWPRAAILVAFFLAFSFLQNRVTDDRKGAVYTDRNFYGVVRVVVGKEDDGVAFNQLIHGTTLHGVQIDSPGGRNIPTAYYSPSSGLGIAAADLVRSAGSGGRGTVANIRFGVVGMGAGTVSTFAKAGDRFRYYEINPEVIAIAQGPEAYFTFIDGSPAAHSIVPGDARQSLERELAAGGPQKFDILTIDAFSGDSIPLHLVTREAFRVYAAHLSGPRSILAVHVTNQYLDLEPVIAANAVDLGFSGVRVDSTGDRPVRVDSTWILLARDPAVFSGLRPNVGRPLRTDRVVFTDRFSNLFQVLARTPRPAAVAR